MRKRDMEIENFKEQKSRPRDAKIDMIIKRDRN